MTFSPCVTVPDVEPGKVPNVEGDEAAALVGRPAKLGIVGHGLSPRLPHGQHVKAAQAQCAGGGDMDIGVQKEAQQLALTFGQDFIP